MAKLTTQVQAAVVGSVQKAMAAVNDFNVKHSTVVDVDYYGIIIRVSGEKTIVDCEVKASVTFKGSALIATE